MHTNIRRFSFAILLIACSAAALAAPSPTAPSMVKPLAAGQKAPAFVAREADGKAFAFNPRKLSRPTMLIFYRGGWCPYCNAHLKDLRTVIPKINEMGYDVLFLSTDRPQILVSSLKEPVDYHLLSDSEVNAARAFGVAYRLDDATYEKYKSYGLDLEESQGAKHHELPVPAVFIVDRAGTIRFAHSNSDYTVRLPAADVLAAAQSAKGK
ncbi:MAG: peroxiredoxin-like family protein [Pseudomonadota bacterium]